MANTTPGLIPADNFFLLKDQVITNLKDNISYKVCHFGFSTIRLITIEENRLLVIPTAEFKIDEWKILDKEK